MVDLTELARMNQIITSLDKMHNGLLAVIDAHHKLEKELTERIEKLEKLSTPAGNAETRPS